MPEIFCQKVKKKKINKISGPRRSCQSSEIKLLFLGFLSCWGLVTKMRLSCRKDYLKHGFPYLWMMSHWNNSRSQTKKKKPPFHRKQRSVPQWINGWARNLYICTEHFLCQFCAKFGYLSCPDPYLSTFKTNILSFFYLCSRNHLHVRPGTKAGWKVGQLSIPPGHASLVAIRLTVVLHF